MLRSSLRRPHRQLYIVPGADNEPVSAGQPTCLAQQISSAGYPQVFVSTLCSDSDFSTSLSRPPICRNSCSSTIPPSLLTVLLAYEWYLSFFEKLFSQVFHSLVIRYSGWGPDIPTHYTIPGLLAFGDIIMIHNSGISTYFGYLLERSLGYSQRVSMLFSAIWFVGDITRYSRNQRRNYSGVMSYESNRVLVGNRVRFWTRTRTRLGTRNRLGLDEYLTR